MDPISFALALGGIPGMFTSCVECCRYIQFGRDFEKDFGMTLCKLEACELRLTRWGTAMGIEGPDSRLRADLYGEEQIKSAYHWLTEIEKAFNIATETSARFKSTAKPEKLLLLDTDTEIAKANDSLNGLHLTMRNIIDGRLKPRKRDRVAWALYKRGNYENLVENISDLVNNLVELFPSTTPEQGQLCRKEVQVMSSGSLELLREVTDGEDEVLKGMLQMELQQRTIHVGEVQVKEDFVGQIGDNVELASQASNIEIRVVGGSGRAMLHIGSNIASGKTIYDQGQRKNYQP
ncbi:hypothetical protein LT330_002041 [Penicillium expansum]|nr:hypothetical protein LT330_002041 [Penicillium expansum]